MKIIQNLFAVLSVTMLLAVPVQAVTTQDWKYAPSKQKFNPGFTAEIIKNGDLVDEIHYEGEYKFQTGTPVGEILQGLIHGKQRQTKESKDELAKLINGGVHTTITPPGPTVVEGIILSDPPLTNSNDSSFDWKAFVNCAKDALPKLKKIIAVQQGPAPTDRGAALVNLSSLAAWEAFLKENRGHVNSNKRGVSCGKHLGKAAFPIASYEEEIKVLTSLLSRPNEEARLLLKAAVASRHIEAGKLISDLWSKYWEILSLKAVFDSAPLPTLEQLQLHILREYRETYGKNGIQISNAGIVSQTSDGLRFAEGLIGK